MIVCCLEVTSQKQTPCGTIRVPCTGMAHCSNHCASLKLSIFDTKPNSHLDGHHEVVARIVAVHILSRTTAARATIEAQIANATACVACIDRQVNHIPLMDPAANYCSLQLS